MNESQFTADIDSGRRTLSMAMPELRLAVFGQIAREGIRWHLVGGLEKPYVVDELRTLGLEAGLDDADIQMALAAAVDRPFNPSDAGAANGASAPRVPRSSGWRSRCSTAAMLQTMSFPPVSYVVPGLLPEGLTLLVGRPKIGKSWLALDLCLAVAADRACFSLGVPEAGSVLYAALEDNPRRLQRRIRRLMGDAVWPARLTLATEWRRLDSGGVDDISDWMASTTDPRLIVLDTLAGIRPIRTTSGYGEDYESLAGLQRLANDRGVAILVLHHTRKMAADDPIDTVSGTLGLSGCADTVLVLARSSKGTTLYLRGRDIEEAERAVQFDKDLCRWTILGHADDVQRSDERLRVLTMLADGQATIAEMVAATGMKRNNLEKLLHFMVKDGEVVRADRGIYSLPSADG